MNEFHCQDFVLNLFLGLLFIVNKLAYWEQEPRMFMEVEKLVILLS